MKWGQNYAIYGPKITKHRPPDLITGSPLSEGGASNDMRSGVQSPTTGTSHINYFFGLNIHIFSCLTINTRKVCQGLFADFRLSTHAWSRYSSTSVRGRSSVPAPSCCCDFNGSLCLSSRAGRVDAPQFRDLSALHSALFSRHHSCDEVVHPYSSSLLCCAKT